MKEWTREERYRVLHDPEEIRDLYDRYRDHLSVTYYSQWYYISYIYFYNRKDYPSALLAAEKGLKIREGTSGKEFSNSVDYLIAYYYASLRNESK